MTATQPAWLRGPMPGVPALLQPVAHALVDADEDVQKFVPSLSAQEIAARPGSAAPIAYHVMHAIPSNVFDLLIHAAEHTARHVGQLVTTAKIVRGSLP